MHCVIADLVLLWAAGGVAVGGVGGGKTETVCEVARAAGQFMATLTCSPNTSAQVRWREGLKITEKEKDGK